MDCRKGEKEKLMYAAIDIGTNTVLLLIADISHRGLEVIREEQRVPRIGRGVDRKRRISGESAQRVIQVLNEYRTIIEEEYPSVGRVAVTATSAVRDSANRAELLEHIQKETGYPIRVLSGQEEAEFTFRGALVVPGLNSRTTAVLDIGGGSTEIALGRKRSGLLDRYSYDIGCVRFTERYLPDDPPDQQQAEQCRKAVRDMLDTYRISFPGDTILLGVAGTVTSLAYMELNLEIYNSSRINGVKADRDIVQRWIDHVLVHSSGRLAEQFPGVMKGRADIFPAGLLILDEVMAYYGFGELTVSTGGIRHGIILDMADY